MKKAVAVPYLVAIIIGIIVLGVIAYWFLRTNLRGSEATGESFCKAKLLQYCGDVITGRIKETVDFYSLYAKDCGIWKGKPGWESASPNLARCKQITGFG